MTAPSRSLPPRACLDALRACPGAHRLPPHTAASAALAPPAAGPRRYRPPCGTAAAPSRPQGWLWRRWGPAVGSGGATTPALAAAAGSGVTLLATSTAAEGTDGEMQRLDPTQLGQLLPGGQQPQLPQQPQHLAASQQGQEAQQQQAGPSTAAAYCQPETLQGLLGQFIGRQDGFDSGLQLDGLLAYYRRLGCSSEQLQGAMQGLAQQLTTARATPPASPATLTPAPTQVPAAAMGSAYPASPVAASRGIPEPLVAPPAGLTQQLQLAAWELLAAAVAAAALAAVQSRPRGWSRRDLLEVRQSAIAGRGLFARAPIPAGTVLGAYPGRLRSASEMVAKCEQAPMAASYAFRTADGRFLDPTDLSGQPSPFPQPGWPWPLPTDVALSYANEPPKGSPGTNATVEDGPQEGDLLFVAAYDIPSGAEVLIDYGVTYDRSGYGR